MGPDHVEVKGIPYPELALDSTGSPVESERQKRKCDHGAILKVVTTNICGSDQHMVRGRTSLPGGHMVLGHEITGEIVELGSDCEFLNVGDICSVPFNIACGRCAACKRGDTGVCLNVNPARAGAAYGYVDMGGWIGGQAEYVMVPYADFNLLKFPDRDHALEKIKDLTLLSDIFPTGFHGAIQADVKPGSIVYVAGAGPVGLASAASCHLLGAACVIVGDMIPERLEQAKSFGCETIDLRQCSGSLKDAIAELIPGSDGHVDGAVDCVGFVSMTAMARTQFCPPCAFWHRSPDTDALARTQEARGNGEAAAGEVPAQVLNDCMDIVREGGSIGIPGLYVTSDPGGIDADAQVGSLAMRMGLGWSKSHSMHTGQCPVMKYHLRVISTWYGDRNSGLTENYPRF
jgi:glutathione-independent formaldehyde dehydrogenase